MRPYVLLPSSVSTLNLELERECLNNLTANPTEKAEIAQ